MEGASLDVIVLLSGGIDSAACVQYYLSRGHSVSALHVRYGQPNFNLEQTAATSIASYYGIPLRQISVEDVSFKEGYIPARNAVLLCVALMVADKTKGLIALGIHADTGYADCTPAFVQAIQRVFNLYEEGRIRVVAPFLDWTKSEIWDYAVMHQIPLKLTYSNNLNSLQPVADHLRKMSK
jgi:7-cyano-7-deazaguanine synthase